MSLSFLEVAPLLPPRHQEEPRATSPEESSFQAHGAPRKICRGNDHLIVENNHDTEKKTLYVQTRKTGKGKEEVTAEGKSEGTAHRPTDVGSPDTQAPTPRQSCHHS